MPSVADRLARLETHREHDAEALDRIEKKLDELLARPEHRGVSAATTTGVSAAVSIAVTAIKEFFRDHS